MLQEKELINITGGKASYSLFLVLGGIVTFLIGVVDGYMRPLKCNN